MLNTPLPKHRYGFFLKAVKYNCHVLRQNYAILSYGYQVTVAQTFPQSWPTDGGNGNFC